MLSKATLHVLGRRTLHKAHHVVHLTYLGLVFIESHGMYGIAAGVLGVIVMVDGAVEHITEKRREAREQSDTSDTGSGE